MTSNTIKKPFDRDAQHAAKRQAVIIAAASAFRRKGYHNTSMVEISRSLGLSKAALYYYVRNKEEILYESHLVAYRAMESILKDSKSYDGTGLEKLSWAFREFVTMLTQSGVSLLTDVDSLQDDLKEEIHARRNAIEKRVTALVKSGQKITLFARVIRACTCFSLWAP